MILETLNVDWSSLAMCWVLGFTFLQLGHVLWQPKCHDEAPLPFCSQLKGQVGQISAPALS